MGYIEGFDKVKMLAWKSNGSVYLSKMQCIQEVFEKSSEQQPLAFVKASTERKLHPPG